MVADLLETATGVWFALLIASPAFAFAYILGERWLKRRRRPGIRLRDCLALVGVMLFLAVAWICCRISRRFREDWESWT